jgi:hypothetical protein
VLISTISSNAGDRRGPDLYRRMGQNNDHAGSLRSTRRNLPPGSVAVEPERAPDSSVGIWLDHATIAKLRAMRGPGASYSDVILRLAEATAGR